MTEYKSVPLNSSSSIDFAAARKNKADRLAREEAARRAKEVAAFPSERPAEMKKSIQERILSFTGGNILGRATGLGIAQNKTKKVTDEIQTAEGLMQTQLVKAIQKNRLEGKDTSRLEKALKDLTGGIQNTGDSAKNLFTEDITTKQVVGDAIQLATTVGTVGSLPGMAKNVVATPGVMAAVKAGAKTGALLGGGTGTVQGFAQGLKQDKSIGQSLGSAALGGVVGATTGGVIGGVLGGAGGLLNKGMEKYANRQSLIKSRMTEGLTPTLDSKITSRASVNQKFGEIIKEAKKQGYSEADINFLGTISKHDKPIMNKMFDLTVKAQSNNRQITRAGDVLGENVTKQVEQVVAQNKLAGKAVDVAAKALRGQEVDATKLQQRVLSELGDLDIGISAKGKLDFSQSVFKNTPAIQKEIQKVISSIPDGSDAYQMHIFKKSIDELVDFGTAGEGLRGRSANLLKGLRNAADEILDTTFDDYNVANTSFKLTKEYVDAAQQMVGKKYDLGSKQGSQAFGQALRSAFSNNKSRPMTLKFIEDTHLLSKQLGLSGKEKNLLDQAIFVDLLEQNFGSEAATGVAGEVGKAIGKFQTGLNVARNPVSGGLNLAADLIEKSRNITPEAKRSILKAFLQ